VEDTVGKDGGLSVRASEHNVQVRAKVSVRAKVFRAATGTYEDLGEIASTEKGNVRIHGSSPDKPR